MKKKSDELTKEEVKELYCELLKEHEWKEIFVKKEKGKVLPVEIVVFRCKNCGKIREGQRPILVTTPFFVNINKETENG